ncbi:Uncharacterised protein [Mycoplasmopsis glycophila]|uniref:Uncharacterized protein n=1 Tax=Mycoplasmopsis glycophila TaxID=171285 RepID=A0A449AV15_9BACT|nr:Uncharacterised protein [Mycoplasmopsis glycophila]
MFWKKYNKYYEVLFWFFLLFFSSIFLCFWKHHKGLFFGFAIGSLVSYLFYKINVCGAIWILTTTKKAHRYIFYFLKYLFYYVFLFLIFYLSLKINQTYHNLHHELGKNIYFNPINFLTMIVGLSLNFVLPIFVHVCDYLINKIKQRKSRKEMNARKT